MLFLVCVVLFVTYRHTCVRRPSLALVAALVAVQVPGGRVGGACHCVDAPAHTNCYRLAVIEVHSHPSPSFAAPSHSHAGTMSTRIGTAAVPPPAPIIAPC